jgi:methyl-accepting chemotaxis protein
MNIKTRLYILTVLNVVACVTVGMVGYFGIERLHPQYNNAGHYRSVMQALDSLESAQETLRADVLTAVLFEQNRGASPSSLQAIQEAVTKHTRDLEGRYAHLSGAPLPVEITWNIADSRRHLEQFTTLAVAIPNQIGKNHDHFTSQVKTFLETFELLQSGTSETKDMLHALWQKDRADTVTFAHSVQNTVVTALLLGIASIIVLVLITLRSILRPIGEAIAVLGASASEVDSSAQKMSLYAEDLAQSATQQAAAVQESVASMTEMSSMIAQTSDSSIESLANARRMAERTQDGNRIMERLASSTEAINQANSQLREMVDIIAEISVKTSVINDIVFKTQLLSFNASIEAARAGQHGRGFAVVAEEFGSLAEISGKAAKEIQSLLETSRKHVTELVEMTHQRVSDGLNVSKEALAIFNEISRDTNQITKQVQRISEATREQTIGVQQTSTAMNQMDQAAQRNSLLAGDTLRNASDLSGQSRQLATIMRELLALISAKERKAESSFGVQTQSTPPRTRVFEVDDTDSLDLAFLQDAAAKLVKRPSSSRKREINAEDDEFQPYNGSSPR